MKVLLLVCDTLSISSCVRLLVVLLLSPLLGVCFFWLRLCDGGGSLVFDVETGLHKHDISLLVKHEIFVLINALVRLRLFGVFTGLFWEFLANGFLLLVDLVFGFFGLCLLTEFGTFIRKKINKDESQVPKNNQHQPVDKNLDVLRDAIAKESKYFDDGHLAKSCVVVV